MTPTNVFLGTQGRPAPPWHTPPPSPPLSCPAASAAKDRWRSAISKVESADLESSLPRGYAIGSAILSSGSPLFARTNSSFHSPASPASPANVGSRREMREHSPPMKGDHSPGAVAMVAAAKLEVERQKQECERVMAELETAKHETSLKVQVCGSPTPPQRMRFRGTGG